MPSIKELYSRLNNVKIDADSINLNTDGLESLLATTQADIALIKADLANGVLSDLRDGSGNAITSTTQGSTRRLDVMLSSGGAVGSTAPTSANLYGGSDGTNLRAISVDSSGRVNANINGTVPVSGTFWQATQPVSGTVTANAGTGSFTVAQATATNLNASVVQGTATNLKTQAENYQGGSAVGSANPLQVTLANTGANTTALQVRPRNGTLTVTSGSTSASANTSAQALASNSSRQYLLIQNVSDTDMYFNFGATATTDHLFIAKSGGGIVFESGFVPTDAVNVICSSASKKYYILSS
jgi:hypothetical protein